MKVTIKISKAKFNELLQLLRKYFFNDDVKEIEIIKVKNENENI